MCSFYAFSDDVHKSFAAGMNEHLAKPIDIENLYIFLYQVYFEN
ncbi:hypothetical protein [Phascolarctobacterium faecium]